MTDTGARYLNRELSWLEFNQRVLDLARDPSVPLLERVKFLAITGSNLDEFFMVRVGGLQTLAEGGSGHRDPSGLSPGEQLRAIRARAVRLVDGQAECFLGELEPALSEAGIRRCVPGELTRDQARYAQRLFEEETAAVLTPMAVTSASDFPLLPSLALNLLVRLRGSEEAAESRYTVLPLGQAPSRILTLPSEGGYAFLLLEELVSQFVDRFFPGETIEECVPFRITRNADLAVREDLAADLLAEMETVLDARKESACVRLELVDACSEESRSFLESALGVASDRVYTTPCPLDVAALMGVATLEGFEALAYRPWTPQPPVDVDPKRSMFETLSGRDVVLVHPFDSYDPVVRLIEEAADDPDTLAIKQVLYRTSPASAIVQALKRAAEAGKYVTAVLELKARFDEARNIEWGRELEKAAVQVIYGVRDLKIHAKLCVIVRREPRGIVRYVHCGTGNYNEVTARFYTDVSLMTRDAELGADATTLFNALSGYSELQRFRKLVMAPAGLRDRLLSLIRAEEENARQGREARITAKLNSLLDSEIVEALYAASQAGAEIRLVVRGICSLRPGVPGLSDNISVVSVVDRLLEHSRVFHFHHGGDGLVFIASADWMPRNLDRRVETMAPIEEPRGRARLIEMLEVYLEDGVRGRRLLPDGTYAPPATPRGAASAQESLYDAAREAVRRARQSGLAILEPHRSPGRSA